MKKNKFIWFIILGTILIGILWVGSWFLIDLNIKEPTDRGTFGDKFGAINSLFSGLAFLGLIITLLFQKEELELQRQELAETRKELEGQKKEFEEQNKIMRRQSFENTLFNMLSLQQEIVNKSSYVDKKTIFDPTQYNGFREIKTEHNGRMIFHDLYEGVVIKYVNIHGKTCEYYGVKSALSEVRYDIYSQIKETTLFDHYFRHLYRIFKYIKESKLISNEERYEYSSIVRSQLSDYEIVMLFYNCISTNGKDKFKPLIEEYAIFNNLRIGLLVSPSHKDLYNKSAYDKYDGN